MRVEKLKNHDLLNLKHEKQIEEFNKMYIYMNYSMHIMTSSSFLVTKKEFYPTAKWRHKTKLQDN